MIKILGIYICICFVMFACVWVFLIQLDKKAELSEVKHAADKAHQAQQAKI